jgi:hypothetical protein
MRKKGLLLLLAIVITIVSVGQTSSAIVRMKSKLYLCKVPFSISELILNVTLENRTKKMTLQEWGLLVDDKKKWPFKTSYSYQLLGSWIINKNSTGLFYKRDCYPDRLEDERSEIVLCVFNNNGSLLSSMVVQASYGDSLNMFASVNMNSEIVQRYEEFKLGSNKEEIKRERFKTYKIDLNGTFIEVNRN